MKVWLTLDPETERVSIHPHEPGDGDFPRGKRGRGWQVREGEIEEKTWVRLLAGVLTPDEQDELHLDLWAKAAS